ncbi:MAG: alkaline phosphatase family protein [Dehalococcoidia bacterium]
MLLPNDHTMGTKPGRPTPRAAVADNDLALGRIVEAISKSKFWPETCVLVTEDDPQAGLDHVDGHRTIALAISPYTKRGFVDSTNYNQTGMLRTIELMLGLPAMNQIDLSATPMVNCFQPNADLAPFTALANNIPLDELNPPLTALTGPAREWAIKSEAEPLDDIDEADEDTLNRIIWHAVKGYDVAYPATEYGGGDDDD